MSTIKATSGNRGFVFLLYVAVASLTSFWARAETYTWTALSNGNWHETGAWTNGAVPGAADDVVLGSSSGVASTLTLSTTQSVNSITLANANVNANLTISNGGSLTIESGAMVRGTGSLTIRVSQTNAMLASSFLTADVQAGATALWAGSGGVARWSTVNGQDIVLDSSALTIGNSLAAGRSGEFTLVEGSTLQTAQNLIFSGSANTTTFNLDGGEYRIRKPAGTGGIKRESTGTVNFNFKRGKITNLLGDSSVTSGALIYSTAGEGYTMDIALGDTGTRTIDIRGNANTSIIQDSTARFIDQVGSHGDFVKTGVGVFVLQGVNAHTGNTTIEAGAIRLENMNALATSVADVKVNNGLVFGAGLTAFNVGGLAGTGNVALHNNDTVSVDLTVGGNDASTTYSGALSAGGRLIKTGSGTLTLSGVNVHTGDTTVEEGALVVNGSLAGGLIVDAGATLGGSGTIGGAATISGAHNPGNSPGLQAFASDLTYNDGAVIAWELVANAQGVRGTDYDGIDVGGNLTVNDTSTINLVFNGTGSAVDWEDAFWGSDRSWTFYDVAGSLSGVFTLGSISQDSLGQVAAGTFSISYSGSDVLVNYTAIPEPAVVTLMALAGVGMLLRRSVR